MTQLRSLLQRIVKTALLAALPLATACLATSDTTRARAHALVDDGAQLVDVRSPSEFAERHPERAVNIPLETLKQRMGELDRARPVVVYCHTGVRAAIAARWLRKAGYPSVHNLGTLGHWYMEKPAVSASFE